MIPGIKKRAFNFYDVMMYVAIGRKHLRLMALLMCFSIMAGVVYYVFARPVYYAKALVHVDAVPLPLNPDGQYHDDRVFTVIAELMSLPMLERTAHSLGIPGNAKGIKLLYLFQEKAILNRDKNLEVEVHANSLELAKRWTEELIRQYEYNREAKRQHDRAAIVETYTHQMEEMNTRIDTTRDAKFAHRDEIKVTQTEIEAQRLFSVPQEIVEISRRIEDVERVRVKLIDPTLDAVAKLSLISNLEEAKANSLAVGQDIRMDGGKNAPVDPESDPKAAMPAGDRSGFSDKKPEVIVTPQMVKSPQAWEDLVKKGQGIKSDMTELARVYLPGHKKMRELQKQLDDVNRALQVELDVASQRVGLELQDLLNKKMDLEAKIPDYEQVQKKMNRITEETAMFKASQLPWQHYVEEMNRRLEALDFDYDKNRVTLDYRMVVDYKDQPVSPQRLLLLLASIGVGLALAVGVPFLIEYLDHTLSNLEQVEATFQLRGLGIVPKLPDHLSAADLLDREKAKENHLIENFRVIRTNLLSMGAVTKSPQSIMVTSAMPKEGKTVVASNLAISFAQTGSRTLLMDTDLRRGRMHRLFGYRKSPGLSDVLLGESTLDQALRPTSHDKLTILSAGEHIDTGTELLSSEKFHDIMRVLRERYDRIILDTPPVLGLSETSVLQSNVDGVLFVIWSGNTPIRNMQSAIEMLQANGANFYGFVLNRLDLNDTTNYYQYYYYSHDYYYSSTHALETA